ncbi:ty3-gypsy retrotransposon protein [Tanacetum coccineum]
MAFRTHDGHYDAFRSHQCSLYFPAHLEHLECVLQRLQEHHFYVKRSKCVFGAETLEYLGHIISGSAVAMDPKKRFIKGYATLAAPLTDLLRKIRFKWGVQEATAFAELKHQLTTSPILSLPNFDQVFVVEADASATGIWAVLLQNNRPISFFSRKLGPRMCVVATYQKELFAIVEAVYKWRQYLVADALSRLYEEKESLTASFMAISQPVVGLLEELHKENKTLEELVNLHHQIEKGKSQLKGLLLREFHDTPSAGHGGVKKILVVLSSLFYWPGMRMSVDDYIKQCLVCQQTKYSTQAIGGYLQPLPTPSAVWEDTSMDFITGLPASKGLTVILMVVDRFSKYAHFGPLPTSFNGHKVA